MAQKIIEGLEPDEVSSLTLAFLGDSVYELIVRTCALESLNGSANDVNKWAKKFSNAQTQAWIADTLADELNEKELHIYKRGRNAKSISAPHTCTISEYRKATGFEALCAYLYLNGDMDRAVQLVRLGIEKFENRQI